MAAQRFNTAQSMHRIDQIMTLLCEHPRTAAEMAEEMCCTPACIWLYLRHIRREVPRNVHIDSWLAFGNTRIAVYAAGTKEDAPRPKCKTKQQILRDFRKRLRADPARHMDAIMAERKRKLARKAVIIVPPADPLLAWIPRRAA